MRYLLSEAVYGVGSPKHNGGEEGAEAGPGKGGGSRRRRCPLLKRRDGVVHRQEGGGAPPAWKSRHARRGGRCAGQAAPPAKAVASSVVECPGAPSAPCGSHRRGQYSYQRGRLRSEGDGTHLVLLLVAGGLVVAVGAPSRLVAATHRDSLCRTICEFGRLPAPEARRRARESGVRRPQKRTPAKSAPTNPPAASARLLPHRCVTLLSLPSHSEHISAHEYTGVKRQLHVPVG